MRDALVEDFYIFPNLEHILNIYILVGLVAEWNYY